METYVTGYSIKPIKNFPNYKIDTDGNVFNKKGNILVPCFSGKYLKVVLPNNSNKYIHRLVAEHFLDNPENKYSVNHIDGNPTNNNVNNLEWATGTEQNTHAYDLKLKLAGEHCNFSKLKPEQVLEIRKNKTELLRVLAKKYNVSESLISMIRNEKIWKRL